MKRPIINSAQRQALIENIPSQYVESICLYISFLYFVRYLKRYFCKHEIKNWKGLFLSEPQDAYAEYRCMNCKRKFTKGWYDDFKHFIK